MRIRVLGALAALLVCVGVLGLLRVTPASSQDRAPARMQSSLELGRPFDLVAQAQFESQLTPTELARLIQLKSRFALADSTCPVPPDGEVFYLKLRGDMTRALANRLAAREVAFVGYAFPHTHMLRASSHDLSGVLSESLLVLGTLPVMREDRMSRSMYDLSSGGGLGGEYEVLFWRDVTPEDAAPLLVLAKAQILEGGFDGASPRLTLALPHAGVQALLDSNLVEQIAPRATRVSTNQTSAALANADPATIDVSPYDLDGNGQVAAVWDAGVARMTHEQYGGLAGVSAPSNWPGTSRVFNMNTTLHNHAAHVTGTIVGNGTGNATAQGYAPRAVALVHLWNNIDSGRRDAKHNYNHVADNHSYADFGNGGGEYGDYNSSTQEPDITNRDILTCMVQSAGNYATYSPYGSKPFGASNPTCSIPTTNSHRNGFIIAAAEDNEDLAGFSSCGPALDGRLTPQFCANGVGLTSSISSSNTAYDSYSGTSMSGPSVCGSVVLLSQLWRREHNDQVFTPDVARAVLAQTCRDKYHPGPDYHYGFGIVDVQAAADLMLADKASGGNRIFRGTTSSGRVQEYSFTVSNSDPIHMVLTWLDVWASVGATVSLVNNLDIELEDPVGGIYYPWRGVNSASTSDHTYAFTNTGANIRDNIELVHVDAPMAGNWTLRVTGTSIPANPQTGIPNDQTGWVVASSHEVSQQKLFFNDAVNGGTAVNIPDNNTTGISRTFVVNDARVITGVRVHTRIHHERRGDVSITLQHPGGTTVTLKSTNNGQLNGEYDVIAVFPDTKQDDDDMSALTCLPVQGTWTVRIRDTVANNTGALHYLALEFDLRSNSAPVADAGTDVTVRENNPGQLNAGGSSDADGDTVFFAWQQTGGSITLTLNSASVVNPTFTAPSVTQDEVVTFEVTTSDCSGAFTTDTVQVTVQNNLAPVASAGADFGVLGTDPGALDATASTDPESDPLTYAWVQTSGIAIALTGANTAAPTFTAPAVTVNELATFEVTVTDDRGDFSVDAVQVTIEVNVAPVANAGPDQAAIWSAPITLDGTASTDANSGDVITWAWVQIGGTNTVVLTGDTTAQPTFTAPATDDTLRFELTVTDRFGLTSTDRVVVYVNETGAFPSSSGGGKGKKSEGGGCVAAGGGAAWGIGLLALLAWRRRKRR
ncbi:MAG: S8 family serine peptidase [Planctomycetes bacterium]|nr:S8 family serine peptidase [Planctomycetota bacterium]